LRALAIVAALGVILSAAPAAALNCLNSKACGYRCIPWSKVCQLPPACPKGYYLCRNNTCVPDGVLCRIG
jgi:hypothetical protein